MGQQSEKTEPVKVSIRQLPLLLLRGIYQERIEKDTLEEEIQDEVKYNDITRNVIIGLLSVIQRHL